MVLKGHHFRVIMVNWSPHDEGRLVSVSYDGSAQVWDVADGGKPVANFGEHFGRLLCCLWSPTDPDLIYTAGDDSTLRGFHISQQKNKVPKKAGKKPKPSKEEPKASDNRDDDGRG